MPPASHTALDYITVQEAAALLGYTVQHTRLLIRQGRLSAVKLGRDWLVSRDAVTAAIQSRARTNPEDGQPIPERNA